MTDYDKIAEIKTQELNTVILSHLKLSDDLVESIKMSGIRLRSSGAKKRGLSRTVTVSAIMCRKRSSVIARTAHFQEHFNIKDGMVMA